MCKKLINKNIDVQKEYVNEDVAELNDDRIGNKNIKSSNIVRIPK